MPADYTEIAPSPVPELYENAKGETHLRVMRHFLCTWANVNDVILYLYSEAGSTYFDVGGCLVRGIKTLSRGQISGTTTAASYTSAILRVRYDTQGPRWVNGVYRDEAVIPQTFRNVPPAELQWSDESDVSKEDVMAAPAIHGACLVESIGRATSAPTGAYSKINMVNTSTKQCNVLPYSFAPRTLLYGTPVVRAHTDFTLGTRFFAVWRHPHNPFGWNKFWNAKHAAWEYLYSDGDLYVQHPPGW